MARQRTSSQNKPRASSATRRATRKVAAKGDGKRPIRVGVIAAAGKGTRAYPRTSFIPKPLFTFENQSLLERNVDIQFRELGVEKLFVIVGHLQEAVLEEVNRIRRKYPDREIETAQWTKQGLAADVASLRDRIDGDFALILGDEFYHETDHAQLKRQWRSKPKSDALIAVLPTRLVSEIRKNYSVELKGTRIQELIEKPEDPPNNLLGLGSYVFTPRYFEYFDTTPPSPKSGVIELTQVIDRMAREGEAHAVSVEGRYFNINSLADYYAANYMIRSERFDRYSISLVVPALNNEATLPDVLADFEDQVNEIIVVDMGSKDRTAELARGRARTRVLLEDTPTEKYGVHYAPAIYAALSGASGDILVLCPADGSFRAGDLPKLLEYLKDCDMSVGTRTTRQLIEQGSNLSSFYRWLNVFFGKLVEVLWWGQEPRFTDIGCIYRAIWKDSFRKISPSLKAMDKTWSVEMMIEIMRYHMRCIEAPVSHYRTYGAVQEDSFWKRVRYFVSIFFMIFGRRFSRE